MSKVIVALLVVGWTVVPSGGVLAEGELVGTSSSTVESYAIPLQEAIQSEPTLLDKADTLINGTLAKAQPTLAAELWKLTSASEAKYNKLTSYGSYVDDRGTHYFFKFSDGSTITLSLLKTGDASLSIKK